MRHVIFRLILMMAAVSLAMGGCARGEKRAARGAVGRPQLDGPNLAVIRGVERQAFVSQVGRVIEAMRHIGSPIARDDLETIDAAMKNDDDAESTEAIQRVLNKYCLIGVHINLESRVKLTRGPARAELAQSGWRAFLIRVHNEPPLTAGLRVHSHNAGPVFDREKANALGESEIADRWMDVSTFDKRPLNPTLGGLKVEYRIIQIYSRDVGLREGHIAIDAGQGTQDIGFRNDLYILFDARPSVEVRLRVLDANGDPTTAAFIFEDSQRRIYPFADKRSAPDFFFHDQVYRADGETILLPPGPYRITFNRGPEYLPKTMEVEIPDVARHELEFHLEPWIDPSRRNWFSGDHHIHAAGCLHYKSPELGVDPDVMMRHVQGENLNVGCVLSWGPGWYHQKGFFTGSVNPLSTDANLIRYDVEVSGFPSDHCGHLVLLNLTEDDYPGTEEKEDWPSWDLPILKWAKGQGAVVGVAHSGWGLDVFPEQRLPNYKIPPMNSIGAQEYLVDVALNSIDFISTIDTPSVWELNIWYHTLNCGFETKISGETDFPCIYGDRVGMGRSYVKLDNPDKVQFDPWVRGIKSGNSYVSDGLSHLMDFQVEGVAPGGPEESKLELDEPGIVRIRAHVAAWLAPEPEVNYPRSGAIAQRIQYRLGKTDFAKIRDAPYNRTPYWHVERARIGNSRQVPVEVVVNGRPVAREEILADGAIRTVEFDIEIERSSWVALRILASSHTNPVFVHVGGRPIRASRLSAQWCLDSIAKVWEEKARAIRDSERENARKAFKDAIGVYLKILEESQDDRDSLDREDKLIWQEQRDELLEGLVELDQWELERRRSKEEDQLKKKEEMKKQKTEPLIIVRDVRKPQGQASETGSAGF